MMNPILLILTDVRFRNAAREVLHLQVVLDEDDDNDDEKIAI